MEEGAAVAQGMPPADLDAALGVLGHRTFRPGQREVVEAVLAGRDVLAVMPTGAGKSVTYQLPSLLLPGVTLVVSPLLALIKQQVARAEARGLAVTFLAGDVAAAERTARVEALAQGRVRLIYAAPEGLRSPAVLDALRAAGVALLCVDEAHVISAWGHDFRPDYARLGALRSLLAPKSMLACTATATPAVQRDILRSLGMDHAQLIRTPLDRPNLSLSVVRVRGSRDKMVALRRALVDALGQAPTGGPRGEGGTPRAAPHGRGSGIVYCSTRKASEEVAGELTSAGIPALAYHAGLAPALRDAVQAQWEAGWPAVVCATTAFGMGVDKPDVRVVVHHSAPPSLEAYYQEVGRAGRDGLPASGVLLWDAGDIKAAQRRVEQGTPDEVTLRRHWDALRAWAEPGSGRLDGGMVGVMTRLAAMPQGCHRGALLLLQAWGMLKVRGSQAFVNPAADATLPVDDRWLAARTRSERARLGALVDYAERSPCRRARLVAYFQDEGEVAPGRCGRCDLCQAGAPEEVSEALRTDILKALSCVARMHGRFGRQKVAEVLTGARTRAMVEAGLHRLSTYGVMRDRSRQGVLDLLAALERAGLLCTEDAAFPTLELTDQGDAVMRSGVVPPMPPDIRGAAEEPRSRPAAGAVASERSPAGGQRRDGHTGPDAGAAADPQRPGEREGSPGEGVGSAAQGLAASLVEPPEPDVASRLKRWRANRSREHAVSPQALLGDRTLDALVRLHPRNHQELLQVPGLGADRVRRFGGELLAEIRSA